MLHFKTNVWNVTGRLFFMAVIIVGLIYAIIQQITIGNSNHDKTEAVLYFAVSALLFIPSACITS
jgi:hypothetical protein